MRHKPANWKIADLVDLEFFLVQDSKVEPKALANRDRELYRTQIEKPTERQKRHKRPELLRRWLELRREEFRVNQEVPLPGELINSTITIFRWMLFLFGGVFGISLAGGVLGYSGNQPINLIVAFILLVVLPFFLTIVFGVLLPAWRFGSRGNNTGYLGSWLINALLGRLSGWIHSLPVKHYKGQEQQIVVARIWGNLRGRGGLYAGVMNWLTYSALQLFGVGFSLGILVTTVLSGWFSDLAFSWQTTTKLSAAEVYVLVRGIATPWASFVDPSLSHPTLEQVVGSRVYLKEGLENLANADLQAWWPFLVWAIAFYVVLPRLALLGIGLLGNSLASRRLSFNDARCEALFRRMQQAQIQTGQEDKSIKEEDILPQAPQEDAPLRIDRLRVLIPAELLARPGAEHAKTEIQREFNATGIEVDYVSFDGIGDAEVFSSLSGDAVEKAVLLILEGWQPCINETLEYLKSLRRVMGYERLLVVGLVGREGEQKWATPAADQDFNIWRSRLDALADPYLLVHNWGKTTDD